MPKGEAQIHDIPLKRIRALKMLEYRVMNAASYRTLAERFNVSEETVRRTLSWAERAGLVAEYEDQLLQELVPLAKAAIKEGLGDSEHKIEAAKIGLELLKGLVPSFGKPKVTTPSNGISEPDDLARHIESLRGPQGVIEGQTVPALEAGSESSAPEEPSGSTEFLANVESILETGTAGVGSRSDSGSSSGVSEAKGT